MFGLPEVHQPMPDLKARIELDKVQRKAGLVMDRADQLLEDYRRMDGQLAGTLKVVRRK